MRSRELVESGGGLRRRTKPRSRSSPGSLLFVFAVEAATLVGVAACGGGAASGAGTPSGSAERVVQPPISKGSAPWQLHLERERKSGTGRYAVAYVPVPDPIPRNEIFDLDLEIERIGEAAPRPDDLSVRVRAEMPIHNHGMNTEPIVSPQGEGAFRVEGMLFHMVGHWQIYVELTDDRLTEAALFDVLLE